MKFPFVRRKRHDREVARQKDRVLKAKSAAQTAKESLEQLRVKRADERQALSIKHAAELAALRAEHARELEAARTEDTEAGLSAKEMREAIQGRRDLRSLFATRLSGEGLEIGALHRPLPVPPAVSVRYVDISTRDENLAKFPQLPANDMVETTFVCDGQSLSAVPDASQDFVIANHMLEHCVNPLLALRNFLRVLKPDGRLFVALPDKRFTFDLKRPVTPWEHVLDDFRVGRMVEERRVYEEYRDCVSPELDVDAAVASRREIHHHAWTQGEILELFIEARRTLKWPLEIELFAKQGCEVVLVLQKADPPHEDHAKLYERMQQQAAASGQPGLAT